MQTPNDYYSEEQRQQINWEQQRLFYQQKFPHLTQDEIYQLQLDDYNQQLEQYQQAQTAQETHIERKAPSPEPRRPFPWRKALKLLLIVAIIGGVAYGIFSWVTAKPPQTAVVAAAEIGESYAGSALIVRNEIVFDEEAVQNIDFVAQEASAVTRGSVLCYVYSSGYSAKEKNRLRDIRDEIKVYQRFLIAEEPSYDQRMEQLDNDLVQKGLELRSLVHGTRGSFTTQEQILEEAIDERQTYFRSKYTSDMRLNRLYDDEKTQVGGTASWIHQQSAKQDGIVSFYTDGFERTLTPATYETLTPTEVQEMIQGKKPKKPDDSVGYTDLYRIVRDNNSYAVLMLVSDDAWNPVEGETYKLVLEQFSNTIVDARIQSFTRAEGKLLLRLAVIGDVSQVLYPRSCKAKIGKEVDCLVVPKSAYYEKNGKGGVIVNLDTGSYFVPCTIFQEDAHSVYLASEKTGDLTEGQTVRLFH